MNPPLGAERLTLAPAPVEAPATVIEFMHEGYAIEKNPVPAATLIIPASPTELMLTNPAVPEGDTAVLGADRDAVISLLMNDGFIPLDSDNQVSETMSTDRQEEPKETMLEAAAPEKRGLTRLKAAVRRSRIGRRAAIAATTAVMFFGAHTESADADTQKVFAGPAIEFTDGVKYLEDFTSPVPTSPNPGTTPEAPAGGASGAQTDPAPSDPEVLKKNCVDVALQKPKILNAAVIFAGNFDVDKGHTQQWILNTKNPESMPDYCKGLYGRSNKARAQAFHNGHWVNEGDWHAVNIMPESNRGSWVDVGNVKQVFFAVCKARILLQATATDLTRDTGKAWPPHPIIAKRKLPPVPVKHIRPRSRDC
jgi:hypothetical protein